MAACATPAEPQSWIIYSSGEPIKGVCVEFRLLYSGNQLLSNGDPTQKHVIRREFHPQLKHLWKSNSQLVRLATGRGISDLPEGGNVNDKATAEAAQSAFFNRMGNLYQHGNHRFVPLIEQSHCLRVSIDILFLRRDQHPLIKEGGDIDNRLKTLFDAFRVPDTTAGLGGAPGEDEDPFFVLLEDDGLISEIKVSTDNLLMLPQQKAADAKDAFLVIDVKLKPTNIDAWHSWAFQ
jgi:hypothetical protein